MIIEKKKMTNTSLPVPLLYFHGRTYVIKSTNVGITYEQIKKYVQKEQEMCGNKQNIN